MWALNLMKYRARADYVDGRETSLTGQEADDVYAPHEHLRRVGSRVILEAPVVHQLAGDDTVWDRVAIAQYRDRKALLEMSLADDFAEAAAHKEAGMDTTIVLATFPVEHDPVPPLVSGADDERLLLLQVVADVDVPDAAEGIRSTRIGRFWVEDHFFGDHRTFAEARFDVISRATGDMLAAREQTYDAANYVLTVNPRLDDVARSLSDPTRVLF